MDREELIIDALRDMRETITANHVEVVQRLTALETVSVTHEDLAARVGTLEKWQSRISGGLAVVGALFTALIGVAGTVLHKLKS